MEKELRRRIAQEGFEISFNPPGDGNCFYRAAAFQLGLQSEILHKRIFDYLEGHQFDVSYCITLRDRKEGCISFKITTTVEEKTEMVFLLFIFYVMLH